MHSKTVQVGRHSSKHLSNIAIHKVMASAGKSPARSHGTVKSKSPARSIGKKGDKLAEETVADTDVYSVHQLGDWLPLARRGVVPPASISEGRLTNFMPGYEKIADMDGEDALVAAAAEAARWRPPPFFVRHFHDEEAVRRMTYKRLGRTDMFVAKISLGIEWIVLS